MDKAQRPAPDAVLSGIADYVVGGPSPSAEALETARYCLMDSLGCGLLALRSPGCAKLLGPLVPGGQIASGARVPGTAFELDPVQAAFDIGCMIRWLDFNDTWLAAEWGHPSDNLGGLLATADYLSRQRRAEGQGTLSIRDLLLAMIKVYEIQGVLALENSFNELGLDHVLLVRIATSAVVAHLLGGSREQVISAVSNAWLDGGTLRLYRHAPNVGPRKGWAAGDATSRGVRLALMARQGEPGYPNALTAETWGFYAVFCHGQALRLPRPYGSYVMENILFKVAYPAEFHAQTAVEAAIALHPQVVDRLGKIETITLETQRPGMRIINKAGPLESPADRDHCLQYTVVVALLFGRLTATDYEDEVAADPRIDALRGKMTVTENARFTQDYYDPERRAIGNAVQVFFNDGTRSERLEVNYPLGHRRRRSEALPKLWHKFDTALSARLDPVQTQEILQLFQEPERLEASPVDDLMARLATPGHGPG